MPSCQDETKRSQVPKIERTCFVISLFSNPDIFYDVLALQVSIVHSFSHFHPPLHDLSQSLTFIT